MHFWNADWMGVWTLACIRVSLVGAPVAFAVGDVVHEGFACQTLAVPACGENDANFQFRTSVCREALCLVFTGVDWFAVVPIPFTRTFATAVKPNTSLRVPLPGNHLKSRRKRHRSGLSRSRGAPHIVGRSEINVLDMVQPGVSTK